MTSSEAIRGILVDALIERYPAGTLVQGRPSWTFWEPCVGRVTHVAEPAPAEGGQPARLVCRVLSSPLSYIRPGNTLWIDVDETLEVLSDDD